MRMFGVVYNRASNGNGYIVTSLIFYYRYAKWEGPVSTRPHTSPGA